MVDVVAPRYPSLRWDLVSVVAVAIGVQVVFRDRADWASHVLAGGAVVIIAGAALGERLGAWATTLGVALSLLLGLVVELTVSGPFDPGDVAFTLAGALVVTGQRASVVAPGAQHCATRRVALAWGVGLLGLAVFYRYGIRRGP